MAEAPHLDLSAYPLVAITGVQYNNPTDPRFNLSLENASNMREAGVPLLVVDSSNPDNHESVALAHQQLGAIVEPAAIGGIATQRQQGVASAVEAGARKILSGEPEKVGLATHAAAIADALDVVDVLVIGRTPAAEDSLPPVQQRTERLAGWLLERVFDLPADALSGARGFTVAGAEVLADYQSTMPGPDGEAVSDPKKNNWIYLYEVPLEARQRGLRIGGLALDLIHPEAMVEEETGNPFFDNKRFDQFELQLTYLLGNWLNDESNQNHPDRDMVAYAYNMTSLLKGTSLWFQSQVLGCMESFFADYGFTDNEGGQHPTYSPAERLLNLEPGDPAASRPGLKYQSADAEIA